MFPFPQSKPIVAKKTKKKSQGVFVPLKKRKGVSVSAKPKKDDKNKDGIFINFNVLEGLLYDAELKGRRQRPKFAYVIMHCTENLEFGNYEEVAVKISFSKKRAGEWIAEQEIPYSYTEDVSYRILELPVV